MHRFDDRAYLALALENRLSGTGEVAGVEKMNQAEIDAIYLGRNKLKKRTNVYFYEAMLPVMRKKAFELYGKRSASLYAFMAVHKDLKKEGVNFKALLNK